jgi:hypothetical protein
MLKFSLSHPQHHRGYGGSGFWVFGIVRSANEPVGPDNKVEG